ncbi:ABC transporter ATP-binding protein [Clostridia bacterium]|nr:ABC transporter ATP-binding protein [Clostridia bacterium]
MSGEIDIRGITKRFAAVDKSGVLTVLDNVSVTIQPGEFVSILGASGCGKSTLLRIIAGLETATEGEALWAGEKISGTSPKRILVFQEHTLLPWLTVRGNIVFALKGVKQYKEKKHTIPRWLELAGLTEFENSYPHQLSGGMRQRAALIRALAVSPDALLLDEPLGALDNFTRMTLQDELVRLWQENSNTMMMITHDVDEAIFLSQRVVVMSPRPGRVREIIDVPMSYPRNRAAEEFQELRTRILKHMNYAHDVVEAEFAI